MNKISEIFVRKDDLNKKVYRKKYTYTLEIVQDVVAGSEDEAETLFLDGGGIDYDEIRTSLAKDFSGVETQYVDANLLESDEAEAIGKVGWDPDDEYAEENGFVEVVELD